MNYIYIIIVEVSTLDWYIRLPLVTRYSSQFKVYLAKYDKQITNRIFKIFAYCKTLVTFTVSLYIYKLFIFLLTTNKMSIDWFGT